MGSIIRCIQQITSALVTAHMFSSVLAGLDFQEWTNYCGKSGVWAFRSHGSKPRVPKETLIDLITYMDVSKK